MKYLVTQEIIMERTVLVDADDESQADELATLGSGEIQDEFESTWATTLHVEEIENDTGSNNVPELAPATTEVWSS